MIRESNQNQSQIERHTLPNVCVTLMIQRYTGLKITPKTKIHYLSNVVSYIAHYNFGACLELLCQRCSYTNPPSHTSTIIFLFTYIYGVSCFTKLVEYLAKSRDWVEDMKRKKIIASSLRSFVLLRNIHILEKEPKWLSRMKEMAKRKHFFW